GMPDRFAGLRSRRIVDELIERTVDKAAQETEEMALCIIDGAVDRVIAIDGLLKGKVAVGKEAFDKNRMAVRADDVMLGRIILAGDAGYVDVARTVGVANRLASDVSGTVGRQHLNRIGRRARETRQQIAGFHGAIAELQKFDVHEMIATVAVRDPVAHHELAVDDTDVVVTGTAGEYRRIASIAAVDVVVASGACDAIVAGATVDHIIVRRCTEEPVLVTGRVDMDVADVEVERAGR